MIYRFSTDKLFENAVNSQENNWNPIKKDSIAGVFMRNLQNTSGRLSLTDSLHYLSATENKLMIPKKRDNNFFPNMEQQEQPTQLGFPYWKFATKTLEKGMEYIKK